MKKTVVAIGIALTWANPLVAAEYYVAPNGKDSNPGTASSPWATVAKANSTLQAGDTVYLRSGEYKEVIKPARSGQAGRYITYKAAAGETPVITDSPGRVAIVLSGRSYIRIDGLRVDGKALWDKANLERWAQLTDAHYNVIQNTNFKYAKGWGCFTMSNSKYNQLLNNSFDYCGTYSYRREKDNTIQDAGDSLIMNTGANSNLIEGNTFTHGGHNLMEINSSFNVFRSNIYDNNWQETEGSGKGNRTLSLKGANGNGFNVFEKNIVTGALVSSDNAYAKTMKGDGINQIIRHNVIYGNNAESVGGAPRNEVPKVDRMKVYHNVIYSNGGPAFHLATMGGAQSLKDNVFKNNIVYRNALDPKNSNNAVDVHMSIESNDPINGTVVSGNAMVMSRAGDSVVYVQGIGKNPLSWFERNYPGAFSGNIQVEPDFVSSNPKTLGEFKIREGSPLIDKAVPLTETANSGSGRVVQVDDAGYFMDGFGIVQGDRVQIGSNPPVTITGIDYDSNTITLASPITWNRGDGVSLPYNGSAPDIGAHETGEFVAPPNPPSFL